MLLEIFTVSELSHKAQQLLESYFSIVCVKGEISNLSIPRSGHMYFSLKDDKSQIKCAFFRYKAKGLQFDLKDGLEVQVHARVSIYPDRGDFQLIIDEIHESGEGVLKKAYDALVKKLAQEGLFDANLKQPLPLFPKSIGVITSPTGAAIRDIISVLTRRSKRIPIFIYPATVQGTKAASEIVNMIQIANERKECDVLILARGGGSLEDLWPFNEETVARAIFNSKIPIVSGVGHEVDFSISDLIADLRAETPSAAAELVNESDAFWSEKIQCLRVQMTEQLYLKLNYDSQKLDYLQKSLLHPGEKIKLYRQKLDQTTSLFQESIRLFSLAKHQQFNYITSHLQTVSPLNTIHRGYALNLIHNVPIQSIHMVKKEDEVLMCHADGLIKAQVQEVIPNMDSASMLKNLIQKKEEA